MRLLQEERAGRGAIAWAMAVLSELEQRLLVADWCTSLLSAHAISGDSWQAPEDRRMSFRILPALPASLSQSVVRGQDPSSDFKKAWDEAVRSPENDPTVWQPEQLYSLFEAIDCYADELSRRFAL